MNNVSASVNPFAMLVDPQAVLRAVESSATLQGLQRQVCRPLDRHLVVRAPDGAATEAGDAADAADGAEGDFGAPATDVSDAAGEVPWRHEGHGSA